MSLQRYYDSVADELRRKEIVAGLWARAIAEAEGDESKAKGLYIKHRVRQLEDTWQLEENDRKQKEREAREAWQLEENDRKQKEREAREAKALEEFKRPLSTTEVFLYIGGTILFALVFAYFKTR